MINLGHKRFLSVILVIALFFSTFQPFFPNLNIRDIMADSLQTGDISEQLLDNDGSAYVDVEAEILSFHDESFVANATSDSDGWIRVYGLNSGTYRLRVDADLISNGLPGEDWSFVDHPGSDSEKPTQQEDLEAPETEKNPVYDDLSGSDNDKKPENTTDNDTQDNEIENETPTNDQKEDAPDETIPNNTDEIEGSGQEQSPPSDGSLEPADVLNNQTPLGSVVESVESSQDGGTAYYEKIVAVNMPNATSATQLFANSDGSVTIGNATISAMLGFYKDEHTLEFELDDGTKSTAVFNMSKNLTLKFFILRSGTEDPSVFNPNDIKIWLPYIPGASPSIDDAEEVFSKPKFDGESGRYYIQNVKVIDGPLTSIYPMRYTINPNAFANLEGHEDSLTVTLDDLQADIEVVYDDYKYQCSTQEEVKYTFTRVRTSFAPAKYYYSNRNNQQITYNYQYITWPDTEPVVPEEDYDPEQEYKEKYYWGEWRTFFSGKGSSTYKYETKGVLRDTIPYNGEIAQIRARTIGDSIVVLWDINMGWLPVFDAEEGVYKESSLSDEDVKAYIKNNFRFSAVEFEPGNVVISGNTVNYDFKTVKLIYDNLEDTTTIQGIKGNEIILLARFEKTGYDILQPSGKTVYNYSYLDSTYSYKINDVNAMATTSSYDYATIKPISKAQKPDVTYTPSGSKTASKTIYYKTDLSEDNQDFTFNLNPRLYIYSVVDGITTTISSVAKEDAYDIVIEDSGLKGRNTTSGTVEAAFDDYVFTRANLYNFNGMTDITEYEIFLRYAGEEDYESDPYDIGELPLMSIGTVAKTVDLTSDGLGLEVAGIKVLYKDVYNNLNSNMRLTLDGYLKKSDDVYKYINFVRNYMKYYVYTDYSFDSSQENLITARSISCDLTLYDKTFSADARTDMKNNYTYSTNSQGQDVITWGTLIRSAPNNTESREDLKNFTVIDVLPAGTRIKNTSFSSGTSATIDTSAAIRIVQGAAYQNYIYPTVTDVDVEEVIDANGVVRDKVIIRFESDPSIKEQRLYKNSMVYEINLDTYISDHSKIILPYVSNYTAVILNDSDYTLGSNFSYYRSYSYHSSSSIYSSSTSMEPTLGTAAIVNLNNGKWKTTDALDINSNNMWTYTGDGATGREYVAWTYSTAILAYNISIDTVMDNTIYPSSEYEVVKDFKYSPSSDLYKGQIKTILSQATTSSPLYARNFTYVNILPDYLKLENGEASVRIVSKPGTATAYEMPEPTVFVEDNYNNTGRQRIMIIFTSKEENPLQLFYSGMSYEIYLQTVLTQFDAAASSKIFNSIVALLYKDFNYGERGTNKTNHSSYNIGSRENVPFQGFTNVDAMPGSQFYDDNGTNDATRYESKNFTINRYTAEQANTYVEEMQTDMYGFKKGLSWSNFAKPATIKMKVSASGGPNLKNTNIKLYNFLPRVGDALESEYDWTFTGASSESGNPTVYYTTSPEVNTIADGNDVKDYTLSTANKDFWIKADVNNLDAETKKKITGIAMDFGELILLANESLSATIEVMMPNIHSSLIDKNAYNKYYTEFDSMAVPPEHFDPFPSNTVAVKLSPPKLTLGDTVFLDENNDGVMNEDEKGLAGVSISLYQIVNGKDEFRYSTVTDTNGKYSLSASGQGNYRLRFSVSPNLGETPPKFSDNISTFEVTKNYPDIKKSIVNADGWTETIVYSYDNFDDFNGKTVSEYRNINAGLTPVYALTLGDTVFTDLNNDGVLNEGTDEAGMGGIDVKLYKQGTPDAVQSTTTDGNGYYNFIVNDDGKYSVKIALTESQTDTYQFYFDKLGKNIDGNVQQNNVDANGVSELINFSAEEAKLNKKNQEEYWVDAALISPIWMNIYGTIFLDIDKDGVMGHEESGLKDIDVKLYRLVTDPQANGADIITRADGSQLIAVRTTKTGEGGTYSFAVAEEGNYFVWVDPSPKYDYGKAPNLFAGSTIVNKLDNEGFTPAISFIYEQGKMQYVTNNMDGGLVEALGKVTITKLESGSELSDNGPIYLPDAKFNLLHENGVYSRIGITTDDRGMIEADGLPVGKYTLTEITPPEGYVLPSNASWEIEIIKGMPASKKIENDLLPPETRQISITKIKSGTLATPQLLEGAEFTLLDANDEPYIEGIITGADGKTVLDALPFGNYTLVETKAPDGYVLNENPRTPFTVTESSASIIEFTVENEPEVVVPPPPGTRHLTIKKFKAGTAASLNPVKLNGAVFNLLDAAGNPYKTNITTSADGTALVKDLPLGEYTLVEITAPTGYVLDSQKIQIVVSKDSPETITLLVENTPSTTTIDNVDTGNNDDEEETPPSVVTEPPGGGDQPGGGELPGGEQPGGGELPGGGQVPGGNYNDSGGEGNNSESDDTSYSEVGDDATILAEPESVPAVNEPLRITQNGRNYTLVYDDDTGMYLVYDEDGTPLGWIDIPVDQSLDDFDLIGGILPLGSIKPNPETGDYTSNIYGFIAMSVLAMATLLYLHKIIARGKGLNNN